MCGGEELSARGPEAATPAAEGGAREEARRQGGGAAATAPPAGGEGEQAGGAGATAGQVEGVWAKLAVVTFICIHLADWPTVCVSSNRVIPNITQ